MRDYAKVAPTFWTGETGRKLRALGPEAQVMALYLITSPHATMTGLYHLPLAYAAHDLGSSFEGASKALRSLSEVGFAYYDEASETVWIPEMIRFQVGETLSPRDNRHKAILRELEMCRKSKYFAHFVAKYRGAYHLPFEVAPEGLESPFEAPSKPLRSQEQEQEQEQEISPSSPPDPTHSSGPSVQDQIRTLCARYPAELVAETREAIALTRRNGKVSDSVWLKLLRQLEAHPIEAVTTAMRTYTERYADGEKGEAYLLGIVRSEAKKRGKPATVLGAGHSPVASPETFAAGDDPLDVWGEDVCREAGVAWS